MFDRIHHVAFLVENLEREAERFETVFDSDRLVESTNEDWAIRFALFEAGDSIIELVEPTAERGWPYEHMVEHGPGFFHVAFEVDDIERRIEELRKRGVTMIDETPRSAGLNEAFLLATIDPGETLVPMQLVEDPRDDIFAF